MSGYSYTEILNNVYDPDNKQLKTNAGDFSGSVTVDNTELESRIGAHTDAESTGDGSAISILKRIRTLLGSVLQVKQQRNTWLYTTGTASASGDTTLIAAPGEGNKLVISLIGCQLETATNTAVLLKDGATARMRVYTVSEGDGIYLEIPAGREWVLTENSALVINLSTTSSIGYTLRYYIEAV